MSNDDGRTKELGSCLWCGGTFFKRRKSSSKGIYCSRQCSGESRKYRKNKVEESHIVVTIYKKNCNKCGDRFSDNKKAGRVCNRCKNKPYWLGAVKVCIVCEGDFNQSKQHQKCCSKECQLRLEKKRRTKSKLLASHRSSKAAYKARRRARIRESVVEYFDPLDVLYRDNYRCKMCGKETPKEKRGSYEMDAPELDHIVPLSKGGEHSIINTQCLCRECNIFKSDKVYNNQQVGGGQFDVF